MTEAEKRLHRVCIAQCTVNSPLGPILLARSANGLCGAWFEGQQHHPAPLAAPQCPDDPLLELTAQQLSGYFSGERTDFDLPLDAQGTVFQHAVWQALREIPSGSCRTYADVADHVGTATAVRAVGAAIGRNPVSVIIPCHRVLGRDGSLTGYAGGLHRKQALLELENALPTITHA